MNRNSIRRSAFDENRWLSTDDGPIVGLAPLAEPLSASSKQRPIIFSAPMIKALRAGAKSQTRRAIKLPLVDGNVGTDVPVAAIAVDQIDSLCPYGKAGDRLWVKETFAKRSDGVSQVVYRADDDDPKLAPWASSLFMPRRLSRITLAIERVRVERLHEIRDADAIAEGVAPDHPTPVDGYRQIWESINGTGSWAPNPWVWVIDFAVEHADGKA